VVVSMFDGQKHWRDQIEKMDMNVLLKRGRQSEEIKGSSGALKDRGELPGHH
jgi:hypothetical protein